MNKESFTAASTFPVKLLHTKVVKDGKIIPIHAQISLTNKCNLNCKFCSCSDRQKNLEISFDKVKEVINILADRGTKAITWTGGGEPLLYDRINEAINYVKWRTSPSLYGIQSGLVTNGILLDKLEHHDNLIWCRISSSDDRTPAYEQIKYALKVNPHTNFAFSHVVTSKPNYEIINGIINFTNENNFTHVRLVSDLCDLKNVPSMEEIKRHLKGIDSKVIYQGRKDYTKGYKECYISLLKPVIAPEGIFPCCGSQYAIKGQKKDMVDEMKMGELKDLADILDNQKYFKGVCDICFYSQYNDVLAKLLNKPEHLNFV